MTTLAEAAALDAADPLGWLPSRFLPAPDGVIYLDGNSLGRPSIAVAEAIAAGVREWATELVGGWEHWIDLPTQVGDRLGAVALGAAPGQVLVGDSTTVQLYKVAAALLAASERPEVVVCVDEFPTDRYVLDGLCRSMGRELRQVPRPALFDSVTDRTSLVVTSLVDFRTGVVQPIDEVTGRGAAVLLDLSHAVGSIPIELDTWGIDAAVGCTYKYLCAGPGAPAFAYLATRHHDLRSPIQGWMAQRDQFAMGPVFDPVDGAARLAAGTPPVLGLLALSAALELIEEVGLSSLRERSLQLTDLLIERSNHQLVPLGVEVLDPGRPGQRGGHLALRHPLAPAISLAARAEAKVVADSRPPDLLRVCPAPLTSTYTEVWHGVDRLADLVRSGAHERWVDRAARVS